MPRVKVLIIVDAQKGFITKHSEHVLDPIDKLQSRFKGNVIFTKFHNPPHSPFRNILDYQKLAPSDKNTMLAIPQRDDATIIDRPYYTCVTQELKQKLTELSVDEVALCGIATEACVLKTALDLFESSIRTWILKDLCASDQDVRYHDMALELLGKLIGQQHIIQSDTLT